MPRILITLGDPAGIGPEVIDLALASGDLPAGFEFEVLGDRGAGIPGKPDARSAQSALDALHEAAHEWDRAAERELPGKRRSEYENNAARARELAG